MPDVLQTLIPYVVVGMLLVAGILFVFALWYFRRGKREPYWRMRRAASLHGWELFLVSVVLVFLAAGVCLFSGLAQAVLGGSTPAATSSEGEILFITATPELDATSRPTGAAATPTTSSQTPQTAQASPGATVATTAGTLQPTALPGSEASARLGRRSSLLKLPCP